jgi:two-component system alkaline phosphatase synthesis response regulator PhoP
LDSFTPRIDPMDKTSERARVLVIDDEEPICDMMRLTLKSHGVEPVVSTRPREALAYCETEVFDMAFVDINMPGDDRT